MTSKYIQPDKISDNNKKMPAMKPRLPFLIVLLISLVLNLQKNICQTAGWPMQGHDAQRTSRSSTAGPTSSKLKWIYDLPVRLQDNACPIVGTDGTIYVPTLGEPTSFLDPPGTFFAINSNGTLKWKKGFASGMDWSMHSAPALSPGGDTVYVIGGWVEWMVWALNKTNGDTLWHYPLENFGVNFSSIAVDIRGTIYVGTRSASDASSPATLRAINPDGTLKWRYDSPTNFWIEAPPAVDNNGNVYFVHNGLGLVALDSNGNFKWSKNEYGDYGWPTPTIGPDGTIYIAGEYYQNQYITAYNADGSIKWRRSDVGAAEFFAGLAISSDGFIIYSGRSDGKVYALNASTGSTIWEAAIPGATFVGGSPLLSGNGILYMVGGGGTSNGWVFAINSANGSLIWKYELNSGWMYWGPQSPALGPDSTLYVVSSGNLGFNGGTTPARLYAFHSNDPFITSVTDGSHCGTGTVTLEATASKGTINWYSLPTGGTSLGTGTSYTTPSLSDTTTYYVDATDNGHTSEIRTAVTAIIKTMPSITGTTDGSRCGTGTLTLGASASAGIINWYSESTGGTSIGTGTSYTTPILSDTTNYYVDATANSCTTETRTAITATINAIPAITGTTDSSRCGTGTITIRATSSNGTIKWYSAATGGTALGTGTSFTTPNISSTKVYFVGATQGSCTTATRTAVTATIKTIPTITGKVDGSRCDSGTVTMMATASAGTIKWYSSSTGGSSLGTGSSFTTPILNNTTTYYVDATANECTTSTRTTVTAIINTTPTITGTTGDSRCGNGTLTLGATASAGTINWYSSSTGSILLGTGSNFITPALTNTTTYYVDATANECITSTRSAVTAIINPIPTITGKTEGSNCGMGTVALGATSSAGTINWYSASTGGISMGTGTSFITPILANTTNYYVDASTSKCTTSARTKVTATINAIPTITGTTDGSRCNTGTVTLGATASAGTINWYASAMGGALLGSGSSFTTPSLSGTTIYFVDATYNGCTTSTRSVVSAIIIYSDTCKTVMKQISSTDRIKIFPNPTSGILDVSINEPFNNDIKIEVYNNIGSLLQITWMNRNESGASIDLSKYPEGLYMIKLTLPLDIYTYRVIKK